MDRRNFLRRTSLALAGGLVVGDEVMALYDRLTHKKVWAMGAMPDDSGWIQRMIDDSFQRGVLFNLPAGTYRIGKTITMRPSFVSIGSVFERTANQDGAMFDARVLPKCFANNSLFGTNGRWALS